MGLSGGTPRSRMCDSCRPPASPPPRGVRPAACAAPAVRRFLSSAAQRLAAFEWPSLPRRCSARAVLCQGPSWTRCQRLRRQLAQSSLCDAGETAVMLKQRTATLVGKPQVLGLGRCSYHAEWPWVERIATCCMLWFVELTIFELPQACATPSHKLKQFVSFVRRWDRVCG